ncbi:MAG: DUF6732 family protein [Albidovulum sp.]|uniref:DUF6732 family protein n=1 Tax=Albidovulum sp. TaxID=1872424 RepID=UPI003C82B0BB
MKSLLPLFALCSATPAVAHPGHLVDVAGHDHWVAGAAIGAAIAMGIWGAIKGRRKGNAARDESQGSEEKQGA